MKKRFLPFFMISFLFLAFSAQGAALDKPYDHAVWDQFLKKFVNDKGQVDYAAAKKDPSLLEQYLAQLSKINPRGIKEWPREEQLALWLNAYHAVLLKALLEHYPVRSTQVIPSFWMQDVFQMGKLQLSLNEIQRNKLIGYFRDEKIYMALGCTGKSCPPFPQEAFTGPHVEGQLYKIARRIVNDPKFVEITPGSKKIYLSQIFKWYAKDFQLDFGTPAVDNEINPEEHAVLSFVRHYLDDLDKATYLDEGKYKVKYMKFDWDLNDGSKSSAA